MSATSLSIAENKCVSAPDQPSDSHTFLGNVKSDMVLLVVWKKMRPITCVRDWAHKMPHFPWIGGGATHECNENFQQHTRSILWVAVPNRQVCHIQAEVLGKRQQRITVFCMSGGWSSQTMHGRANPSFPCRSWARWVGHATFPLPSIYITPL